MKTDETPVEGLEIQPATPARWRDLSKLFGPRGACGGCWCMYWRRSRAEFEKGKASGNRRALKRLVDSERPPGLIAYYQNEPVAWCALGPRADYPGLESSRILQRVDLQPVWSVVCFFVARPFRKRGVAEQLLAAAVRYAESKGAVILEGYPVETRNRRMPDVFAWTGFPQVFRRVGFGEVARRSPTRPIMRRILHDV